MRFRVRLPSPWPPPPPPPLHLLASARHRHRPPSRRIHAANSGDSQAGKGKFLLPGATAAVLVMLGALHARRMYDDKKDIPVFMRPTIYKAWARAFHSGILHPQSQRRSEAINPDPNCLVSPVDGKVLRLGELRGPGTMIEQVKGFSYAVSSLLGTSSSLHEAAEVELSREHIEQSMPENSNAKSWWRVSVASPKLQDQTVLSPKRGIFYCVIYLHPGDYHRVHSPVDWNILKRRHFSGLSIPTELCVNSIQERYKCRVFTGHLFPQNERAIRTVRNLYVENERAIAAIGATNVGSIRVNLEPELRTNRAVSRMVHSLPPEERVYEPEGTGVVVKKGEEIAGFKMGSTVVVVFEAQAWKRKARESSASGDFGFCVRAGDKVRAGEAIGRWSDES
ncbi:hypothetical protein C2845_PM01G00080 [Panicum miliaceum]|uniref:phosphatidylserine decarboxylase n=1 Tax=Panicum miliaceum TaxID=4540 RepID=A0A3L6TLE0_PANMI|nr:hypothetical protein C2845_PM01G00080 [Panicum miliaceum]